LPPGAKQPTCRGCKTAGGWGFSTSRVVSFRALLPLWSCLLALESLLRSGHEPPDVLAVPEHDEKGHRGRCQHNGWRVAEHQDDDRRAERGEYRAQRDDPRARDRQCEDPERDRDDRGREAEQHANPGRDSLSASEGEEDREHVPAQRADPYAGDRFDIE